MHSARAEWPFARQAPSMVVLLWLTRMILVPFAIFAGFSGYRAWVQVKRVALFVQERELRPGAVVDVEGESWARNPVTIRLVLMQGAHAETLLVHDIPANHTASLDPRIRSARLMIPIERDVLARFEPGDAVLRVIGLGRSQWLRVPPPKMEELVVRIPRMTAMPSD